MADLPNDRRGPGDQVMDGVGQQGHDEPNHHNGQPKVARGLNAAQSNPRPTARFHAVLSLKGGWPSRLHRSRHARLSDRPRKPGSVRARSGPPRPRPTPDAATGFGAGDHRCRAHDRAGQIGHVCRLAYPQDAGHFDRPRLPCPALRAGTKVLVSLRGGRRLALAVHSGRQRFATRFAVHQHMFAIAVRSSCPSDSAWSRRAGQ
jgi:hypothetical protein